MVSQEKYRLALERDWTAIDLDKQIVDVVWGQADRAIYQKLNPAFRLISGIIQEQLHEQT